MGVPQLYYTLFKKYNEKPVKTSVCCIDMNSMLYKYFDKNKSTFISKVLDFVNRLEYETIYIAFDGPAPLAKMVQQKMRRIQVEYSNDEIHPIMFTPGTELMEYIRNALIKYTNNVIVSSHREPGEGEQKIMRWIRTTNYDSYTILGNDADILLLAMTCDNVYVSNDGEYIDIMKMKKDLVKTFGNIESFIFMSFLLGNDFLPCIAGLENLQVVLEFMIDNSIGRNVANNINIDWSIANKAFNTLKKYFNTFIKSGFNKTLDVLRNEKNYTFALQQKMKYGEDNNYPVNGKMVEHDMLKNWQQMIQWNLRYYLGHVISWKLCYEFHCAPSLSMIQSMRHQNDYIDDCSTPMFPINAMLTVYPYWWHHISNCSEYPLFKQRFPEQYPRSVISNSDSNIKPYMEKQMIPFPDYDESMSILIDHPLNKFEGPFLTNGKKVKFKFYDRKLLLESVNSLSNYEFEHPLFISVNNGKVYCNRKFLFRTDFDEQCDLIKLVIQEAQNCSH